MPILRLPKWVTQNALLVYVLALATVGVLFMSYWLPWYYLLSGIVSVVLFFFYGRQMTNELSVAKVHSKKNFESRVFILACVPRVLFVLLLYGVFQTHYGNPFGFEAGDAFVYDQTGMFVADLIRNGDFHFYDRIVSWTGRDDISDMGYSIYLGFVYWITDHGILTVRLIKCILSSLTVLLVYRLARRNFGEQIARMSAIFCALWPNFWYYCSAHLKEAEMVFLVVLFVEMVDDLLRSKQYTAWEVIPIVIVGALLFTLRTALGFVALLAVLFTLVLSSSRVVTWGKRIVVGVFAVALIGIGAGERLEERASSLVQHASSGYQKGNMEWRSTREHGNSFAKYANATVFAPLIFTIPFPTMVQAVEEQQVQPLLHGGNFIKNMLSFFTILALVMMLLSGSWREHALILSFVLGYLVVLALSAFPHSERFHQPAMPFEMMLMAYGVSVATTKKKYKSWYIYWCVLMFLACVAWSWFKLKGRGL